jgi:hypothetical protein
LIGGLRDPIPMPSHVFHWLYQIRPPLTQQFFGRASVRSSARPREGISAPEPSQKSNLGTAKRSVATSTAHVQWFQRAACADRDRMTLPVNRRTKCDILFQSPWPRFCSAPGPWPRRLTTRVPRESTGLFEQVSPRVGRRFVRSDIIHAAAHSGAGASLLERPDFRNPADSMEKCRVSRLQRSMQSVANPSYTGKD